MTVPSPAEKAASEKETGAPAPSRSVRIGSICSGYGGLDLGLMAVVGGSVAWHAEIDPNPAKVLDAHWPAVPNYGDIKAADWSGTEPVDWLTAGYPCQPESLAGKGLSEDDHRWIWPEVARAIGVLRPHNVLLENVAGHIVRGFRTVLGSLTELGYDARWTLVRADEAGAPHRRSRLFVVATDANRDGLRLEPVSERRSSREALAVSDGTQRPAADASGLGWRPGTGLRESQSGGIRRGRLDHDDGAAVTDASGDGRDQGRAESAGQLGRPDASECGDAPTHTYSWRREGRQERHGEPIGPELDGTSRDDAWGLVEDSWGDYEPAIRRWEHVTGRRAPRPVEPATRGGERLSPRFVEWLMGLPAGWVTDIDLPRNAQLTALGNGVVPQQAALAVSALMSVEVAA